MNTDNTLNHWPLFGIVGTKNSGKTTLICRLVEEFVQQKYTVNIIKKGHHNFSIDQPNTDSWKFRQAGANSTAVVSDTKCAIMVDKKHPELDIPHICRTFAPSDIILVESYKNLAIPKIEVRTQHTHTPPLYKEYPHIIGLALETSDIKTQPDDPKITLLNRENIKEISHFILNTLQVNKNHNK